MTWTPYPDLDALFAELLEHWQHILGENFAENARAFSAYAVAWTEARRR